MDECYDRALEFLAKVKVSEERKKEIKAYAAEMMTRQS
jgi:geranylgeranyl diphosphate synthase type II